VNEVTLNQMCWRVYVWWN